MMRSVVVEASWSRSSRLSRWLDRGRWRRLLLVAFALALSIGVAAWGGFAREDILRIDETEYVAVAGLFVAALAVERLNELLIAPWVGRGDRAIDRNVLVGSFGLLFGVTISASLGLSGQSILDDETIDASTGIGRAVGIFIAGLAIAGGGKPLHDLISRLEKNVQGRKAKAETPEDPSDGADPGHGPGTRQHGIAIDVEDTRPGATPGETTATLAELLPRWRLDERPDGLVRASTFIDAPPDTAEHRRQVFAAAHRVQSQEQLIATPAVIPGRDDTVTDPGRPLARRWTLAALGLDPSFYAGDAGRDEHGPVRVAVLDTGVRPHRFGVAGDRLLDEIDAVEERNVVAGTDAAARVANWVFDGFDFDLMTSRSHGTAVASVIAAGGGDDRRARPAGWWNESEMIGVAPDAEILPVKVMRGPVHLGDDDVTVGVRAAVAGRADVISMSLGGFGFKGLREAIDEAVAAGTIVVCAAGNNFNVVVEPAFYGTTIAVAATTSAGAPFVDGSSRGPEVDVAAPGHLVPRADFDADRHVVEPSTGTTYATAHVSGVAALWLGHHGRAALRTWYPNEKLPQLFKLVLRQTTSPWPEHLRTEWGTGIVDVPALLDHPVFAYGDNGEIVGPAVADEELDRAFPAREGPEQHDRIVAGIAAVFSGRGTLDIREAAVPALAGIPALLVAELGANSAADERFRERWRSDNPADLPVPAGATPELARVLATSSEDAARVAALRHLVDTPLDDDWGVGFSKPLKHALLGRADTVSSWRWVGVAALLVAVVLAGVLGRDPSNPLQFGAGLAGLVGFLTIGVYAIAQAIERILEFTVARVVFRDVPGREADRALILLGVGVALGVVAAVAFDVGLIATVAETSPTGRWDEAMDALVTGLAVGGGAKPVHDLLTRIRLPLGS